MQTARRPNTSAPGDGSRTLTLNPTSTNPDDDASSSVPSPGPSSQHPQQPEIAGVLRLRGRGVGGPTVQWKEEVVDNEFLGRKKSKICCIYHKPKQFDESSGDESDSSCGSADSRERSSRPHNHDHPHDHNHDHAHTPANSHSRSEGGSTVLAEPPAKPTPNAYEKQDTGKGKGKA